MIDICSFYKRHYLGGFDMIHTDWGTFSNRQIENLA